MAGISEDEDRRKDVEEGLREKVTQLEGALRRGRSKEEALTSQCSALDEEKKELATEVARARANLQTREMELAEERQRSATLRSQQGELAQRIAELEGNLAVALSAPRLPATPSEIPESLRAQVFQSAESEEDLDNFETSPAFRALRKGLCESFVEAVQEAYINFDPEYAFRPKSSEHPPLMLTPAAGGEVEVQGASAVVQGVIEIPDEQSTPGLPGDLQGPSDVPVPEENIDPSLEGTIADGAPEQTVQESLPEEAAP